MIGFSGLVLVLSLVLARLRLGGIRRARLLSGGALVSGISGAFFALDIGLARDIVVERRAIDRGHVVPKRGKGVGLEALIWREWQRLRRFPQPLLVLVATIVVPYAAEALGMGVLTPVFGALALVRSHHPAARRAAGADPYRWPGPVPAVLAVPDQARLDRRARGAGRACGPSRPRRRSSDWAWAPRTGPASTPSSWRSPPAAAGLLAAVRWTQAKGVDFGAPMVSTQAGAVPPGLVTNVFRGFDVCLLSTAPMALGFSPIWSLLIAGIAALDPAQLDGRGVAARPPGRAAEAARAAEEATRGRAGGRQATQALSRCLHSAARTRIALEARALSRNCPCGRPSFGSSSAAAAGGRAAQRRPFMRSMSVATFRLNVCSIRWWWRKLELGVMSGDQLAAAIVDNHTELLRRECRVLEAGLCLGGSA